MLICISGYHNKNATTMYHSHIVLIQFHSAGTWAQASSHPANVHVTLSEYMLAPY